MVKPKRSAKAKGKPVGRPPKLAGMTEEDKTRFLTLLRAGSPQNWACKAIGFTYETLENYRTRAADGEEPYVEFIREVDRAQAGYVIERLRVLDADAIGAPTGEKRERGNGDIKWVLERLFPKDFAPISKQEVTGKDGAPLALPAVEVIRLPELSKDGDPDAED